MDRETFYNESGTSPPRKRHGFELKFTAWGQPMQAVTDHYEEIVLGFRITSRGVIYMAASGREIPAQGTALFALGTEGGAA
ncbi:hypothetical protein [Synechococcus sp. UW179A]|uniref:hypothetical protein n=1 Tax=Synechococcus sp. UW179A TaxID=2575510 RepID=UPI000E0EDD58|nr:hypothetical protein [Synechococcus sp. UW179A]